MKAFIEEKNNRKIQEKIFKCNSVYKTSLHVTRHIQVNFLTGLYLSWISFKNVDYKKMMNNEVFFYPVLTGAVRMKAVLIKTKLPPQLLAVVIQAFNERLLKP